MTLCSTVALIHQHSNVHRYSPFMWIKGRIPWLPRLAHFPFFHRTAELLPSAGAMLFSEILLNFSIKREVHTQRPENHAEASISGLEISGSLPTWGTHPLGEVLGRRLHSPGDRLLSFTT